MPARTPNLLFVFTDEQRLDTLACYGNGSIEMPRLNRFAESASVFEDPHCVHPVCTPSRGTMMTGLYPHQHGAVTNNVPLKAEAHCLPELLTVESRQQYRIEYHGKWHLGDEIFAQHGYERFVSIEDMYVKHFGPGRDRSARSSYHHFLLEQGFTLGLNSVFPRAFSAQLPERYGKPQFLADGAAAFIRENAHRPWMLTVSMLEPHMPFFGPRDAQYDPDTIDLFPNADHRPDPRVPQRLREKAAKYQQEGFQQRPLATEEDWRRMTACYLGLCSLMDTHVGRILDALDDSGLADDTIVVFTSDHGEMMGSHGLLTKEVLYREATRVPWLVRLPGQRRPARLSGPVSHIDLVPTLLDLLGQPVPDNLPGRSLAGPLRAAAESGGVHDLGDAASPCVIVQTDVTRSLVSPEGWRYSYYLDTDEHELYDLNADPLERHNLADDPGQAPRVAHAREAIAAWQDETADPARRVPTSTR